MNRFLLFCMLVLISISTMVTAFAAGEGGTIGRLGDAGANIRLAQEWMKIDAGQDSYTVEVTYKFVNETNVETLVKMAYPEKIRIDGDKKTEGFSNFEMSIGELPVKAVRTDVSKDKAEKGYTSKCWVKNVNFLGKQTRMVAVKYTSKYGSKDGQNMLDYHFSDSGWAGNVASSELLATVSAPGASIVSPGLEMKHVENRLYKKWTDWKPKFDLAMTVVPTSADALMVVDDVKTDSYLIVNAGKSETHIAPAAMQKAGVVYTSLDNFSARAIKFAQSEKNPPAGKVTMDWATKTNAVTLNIWGTTYVFTPDSDVAKVDAVDSKMDGKALLIPDPQKKGESLMYVPLSALNKQLDGAYEYKKDANTVKYSFKAHTPAVTVPEVPLVKPVEVPVVTPTEVPPVKPIEVPVVAPVDVPPVIPVEVPKPPKDDLAVTNQVTINTAKGDIVIDLYGNGAPNTVANFVKLVDLGFYDGLTFHRVETMNGFQIIQGGDPKGDGTGESADRVKLEINPKLKHWEGAIAMARSAEPDSASCQFYICNCAIPQLDGLYAVFGRVSAGMDVAKKITAGDKMIKVSIVPPVAKDK